MPQLKDVQLAFGNFGSSGPFAGQLDNVKVDFITIFAAEESGQTFRVRIDLFEERQNTETNPPVFRTPVPFFTFTYGFIFKTDEPLAKLSVSKRRKLIKTPDRPNF